MRTCNRCGKPIEKSQPYHWTKRGSHHRECAQRPVEKLNAALAAAAEMREALIVASKFVPALNSGVGNYRQTWATINHALSTDFGKGWKSPEDYAALEAKCAEITIKLERVTALYEGVTGVDKAADPGI